MGTHVSKGAGGAAAAPGRHLVPSRVLAGAGQGQTFLGGGLRLFNAEAPLGDSFQRE